MTMTEVPPEAPPVDDVAVGRPRRFWRLRVREPGVAPRSPAEPLSPATVVVVWVFLICALLALWTVLYAMVLSSVQQSGAQKQLFAQLREELALGTAPLGGQIDPGSPVALLRAPEVGIDKAVVVEGTSSSVMRDGPGHRRDTPLPGQPGVSVIYGRSVTYGGRFAHLTALSPGDPITVVTGQGTFTYRVDGVRRTGEPLPPVLASDASRLTLVTAESSGWERGWTIESTVYVDASLVGKVAPAPSGRPTVLPDAEQPMGRDLSALFPLVLWLQALVLVVIVIVWARLRWGVWQTWVVGVPVVVALAWGTTNTAFALLPNLL